jgi:hypothetical protein
MMLLKTIPVYEKQEKDKEDKQEVTEVATFDDFVNLNIE